MQTKIAISESNSKLGKIPSVSLTPYKTCKGATEFCKAYCYAQNYFRMYKNTQDAYERNTSLTVSQFESQLSAYLDHRQPRVFRLHVSGDFYNARYIAMWIRVTKRYPAIKFYGYTRAWRVKTLNTGLIELRKQPNVSLYASVDTTHSDLPHYTWKVAFVGSDRRYKGVACPQQSGKIKYCTDCKLCYGNSSKNIQFAQH